jgi:hypothetical protein
MAFRLLPLLLCASIAWTVTRPGEIAFEKHTIDLGASESAAVADIDGDGKLDIISGEHWYQAPSWTRHKFRTLPFQDNYVDNFGDMPLDVNGDGRMDIVSGSYFTRKLYWMENPGKQGEWKEHTIDSGYPMEFALQVDLVNDGKKRQILPEYDKLDAPLAWYEIQNGAFVKHVVSNNSYGHGIGVGDVNGDGRNDILTPKGWFEAPPDPRTGTWTWHPDFELGSVGFMYVLDVNGDGRNDIVTSMAHNDGIFWMEQGEAGKWTRHMIDESWSQSHAMTMADLNRDGKMDFVTGKRYMAHNGRDPGEREPLGVYWYEYTKSDDGKSVVWIRHVIDYSTRTGGGLQIPVVDIDGDGDLDIVTAGKSGLFLFENLTKKHP